MRRDGLLQQSPSIGSWLRGAAVLTTRKEWYDKPDALPDDVKFIAPFVLAHRMIISPSARLRNVQAQQIVATMLEQVPVPEPELEKLGA